VSSYGSLPQLIDADQIRLFIDSTSLHANSVLLQNLLLSWLNMRRDETGNNNKSKTRYAKASADLDTSDLLVEERL
jgi:hypothetical protein